MTNLEKKQFRYMYKKGLRDSEIAKALNRDRRTISSWRAKMQGTPSGKIKTTFILKCWQTGLFTNLELSQALKTTIENINRIIKTNK